MTKTKPSEAGRDQILAFRLEKQNLITRLPAGKLVDAAANCGIRNSPPGSAELAFQARVAGFSQEKLDEALDSRKLLEVWSVRSSPFFFPTNETAIFTAGLLPFDEEGLRNSLKAILSALDLGGKTLVQALEIVAGAATEALDSKQLTKGELSAAVSKAVPKGFSYWCKGCEAYHVPESFFRLAVQQAGVCFAPRKNSDGLLFVRIDQWLGKGLPKIEPAKARQEALRRYLGCYGPSTAADFAAWAGLSPANGKQVWQELEGELIEVKPKSWLLKDDLKLFEAPPTPQGVRLLPPYDAYLMASDRTTLIPDKDLHPKFWRSLGNPGAVLVDGEIVGSWRPQKKGKKLTLDLDLHQPVAAKDRAELEAEAAMLAPLKGAKEAEVKYND